MPGPPSVQRQMVFGLLCAADGGSGDLRPDPLAAQVRKIRDRFGVRRVLVGDRGMITSARIRTDLLPVGLENGRLRKLLKAPRGNPAGAAPASRGTGPRHGGRNPQSRVPRRSCCFTRGCASNAPASARICCGPATLQRPQPPASTGPGQRTETGPFPRQTGPPA